jgi:hypothetical protein
MRYIRFNAQLANKSYVLCRLRIKYVGTWGFSLQYAIFILKTDAERSYETSSNFYQNYTETLPRRLCSSQHLLLASKRIKKNEPETQMAAKIHE